MHSLLAAIASITKTIGSGVIKCFIGIKNILVKIFTPIAHFIFLLCKGIYTIFKYFFLYVFIKPILFLYHYVVLPIGRGLRYIFIRFYKYIILPPLRGIAFIFKKIGHFLAFIGKKIGLFFSILYQKIVVPIGHFISFIFTAMANGIYFVCSKIYQFIAFICKFIFNKIIKPVCHFISFIFKKIGYGIKRCCLKIYHFFKAIFLFIYNIILYPITYFLYLIFNYIFLVFKFIFEKLYLGIKWFFSKVFWIIRCIAKFIFYKIIKPICLFLYHYILRPIGRFMKFIFTKLYNFLVWFADKMINALEVLGKWIWKSIKFIYQCVSVFIVVSISGLLCIVYTFLVYPIRVLIENKAVASKKECSFFKRLLFNPYYLFIVTKERNKNHYLRFKEKHPDVAIFVQIKNVVAVLPTILYGILFYPINWFFILIFSISIYA